jgi:malate/lactate dehydrogenase
MTSVPKYKNLDERFPDLVDVLKNSIQAENLEIRHINKSCDKFQKVSDRWPELKEAEFVVFSKYVKRGDHKYETFAFIDDRGKIVCHLQGGELELYGMLDSCYELEENEEFRCSWHSDDQ